MSGLDAAFLSLESATTHLQILGVLVFDPSGVEGGVDFWRIRDLVADRVHLVPPFRKRMVEVPFGLQHPSLVDDSEFDLDYHVRRARLPTPGGRSELAALAADLASRPLDRRRPLWEFHVVEGLEHGQVAVIPKIHHSIIDGVSGAEVMAVFFDLTSQPPPYPLFGNDHRSRARSQTQTQTQNGAEQVAAGAVGSESTSRGISWGPDSLSEEVKRWGNVVGSLPGQADALVRTISRSIQSMRSVSERNHRVVHGSPPSVFEAPRTSINRAISSHRRVAFAELARSDIGRVKEALGGTTNDVVLAVTSGAMRTFFSERGEVLESSLVAMVPVSVRTNSEHDALGNRLSALFVSLASGVDDTSTRYRRIRDGAQSAKDQSESIGQDVFAGWAQAVLPAVATRLSRLVTNVRLFDHLAPIFNLIISNVPGPEFPLYLAGARMVAMYPLGPIIEGVGVNVTVFSYLETVYVGVQACWDLAPDIDVIAEGMADSLGALVEAAERRVRPVPWWHAELPA